MNAMKRVAVVGAGLGGLSAAGFLHYSEPVNAPTSISQNADIRYLGRLLGDVIRAYGGESLFERIESIRATSVDRYRGVSRAALSRIINRKAADSAEIAVRLERAIGGTAGFGFACNSTMTWRRYRRGAGKFTLAASGPRRRLRFEPLARAFSEILQ